MRKPLASCFISFLLLGGTSYGQSEPEELFKKQFASFPTSVSPATKKSERLQFVEGSKAWKFRTRLKDLWASAKSPNFAGHYLVPHGIGCGTGCSVIFTIDWQTGKVFDGPEDNAFAVTRSSRLLIINPFGPGYVDEPRFYLFEAGAFVRKELNVSSSAPNLGQTLWVCESLGSASERTVLVVRRRNADDRLQLTLANDSGAKANLFDVAAETWEPKDTPMRISNGKAGVELTIGPKLSSTTHRGILKLGPCCLEFKSKSTTPMEFSCRN